MSAISVGREIMLYYLDTLGGKNPSGTHCVSNCSSDTIRC